MNKSGTTKYQNQILIDVQQIIPLPEAESYQIKIKQQTEERREARKSHKDYTQYIFEGISYNKRKLVLAVIQHWIEKNKPENFTALLIAFPQESKSGGMFALLADAQEIYNKQKIYRHFLGANELISFPDNSQYAISNQWGKGNIEKFIEQVKKIGIEIKETI